jgi:protein TonB
MQNTTLVRAYRLTVAFIFAIALHVLLLLTLSAQATTGAKNEGEMGIEIDLGMLGDLGTAQETVEERSAETQPIEPETTPQVPAEEPDIAEAPPEPQPEPIMAPLKVKQKQKPKTQKKTTNHVVKAPDAPQQDKSPAALPPSDQPATQPVSMQKQSTGRGHALTNGGQPAAERSYYALLAARLAQYKRYPKSSRRRGEEGEVTLFFVLDRSGRVLESRIHTSSGFPKLDNAVIKMLHKAAPLPAFPEDMQQPQLTIKIPVSFKLNS